MASVLFLIALFLATYLGFALLAMSQARHWRAVSETAEPSCTGKLALRIGGGVWLFFTLCLALFRDGPSFGALLWATVISMAALAVAFTLSWQPRLVWPLAALVCFVRPERMKGKKTIMNVYWGRRNYGRRKHNGRKRR